MEPKEAFLVTWIEFQADVLLRRHVPTLPPLQFREQHLKAVETDPEIVARISVISPCPRAAIV